MKKKLIIASLFLAISITFMGCEEDFLERPPLDTLTTDQFYKTNEEVLAATGPLYNAVWRSYNDNASFLLGDMRGGVLVNPWSSREHLFFRTTGVTSSNINAYKAFYTVIGQANTAMANINTYAGAQVSEAVKNQAIAEARFMRATAYTYLVMNFGEVPIITNNIEQIENPDLVRNTIPSIWEFITRDYLFAAENLPESANQVGRVTQWSAEGMLARTYLIRSGVEGAGGRDQEFLDQAKYYAERVITMSGHSLLSDYSNLFEYPYDNNAESLFELQWVFSAGNWDASNSMVSKINPFPEISVNNDAWGGSFGASWWILSLYEGLITEGDAGATADDGQQPGFTLDERLKPTFMMPGFYYPELTLKRDLPPNVAGEGLIVPSPAATSAHDRVKIKKYVVGSELDLGGNAMDQRYPNNVYMLRLAEMYLIYVEATIGNAESTTDPKALEYFNVIRSRAGLPYFEGPIRMNSTWSANEEVYKDHVLEERAVEFAMEARTWYDLVALHYYNPQKAYDIINHQYRGEFLALPDRMPNPTSWTFTKDPAEDEAYAEVSSGNFYMQIPAVELSQAPGLSEPAVDYNFGEEGEE